MRVRDVLYLISMWMVFNRSVTGETVKGYPGSLKIECVCVCVGGGVPSGYQAIRFP